MKKYHVFDQTGKWAYTVHSLTTETMPQPIPDGHTVRAAEYVDTDVLVLDEMQDGRLSVLVKNAAEVIADLKERCNTYEHMWAELFDSSRLIGNGWSVGEEIGLTDAPIICLGADHDEKGRFISCEKCWHFADYQVTDEMAILASGQPVIFDRVQFDEEKPAAPPPSPSFAARASALRAEILASIDPMLEDGKPRFLSRPVPAVDSDGEVAEVFAARLYDGEVRFYGFGGVENGEQFGHDGQTIELYSLANIAYSLLSATDGGIMDCVYHYLNGAGLESPRETGFQGYGWHVADGKEVSTDLLEPDDALKMALAVFLENNP